ncbi:acyltransferase family protein [Streptomyces wedmorensis]|uniref:Acyltransferase family protein n=1 Tax=Streptomyces wedmorensis TaxID=43759 RepID=A0ABW6J7T9_STRWE
MPTLIREAPLPEAPAAPSAGRAGGMLPSLTGMRWAAAFLVFAFHTYKFGYYGPEDEKLVAWATRSGSVGVMFFFVLSGFVLTWSARPKDRFFSFFRRRLARIYPIHVVTAVVALALAFTVLPWLRDGERAAPEAIAANLLLVSSWKFEWWQAANPVSWSLVCEAFFYACFPLLYAVLRRVGPKVLTAVAVLCVLTVIYQPDVYKALHIDVFFYSFPLARLPEFILGVAVARLVQLGKWRGPSLEGAMALTLIGYFVAPLVPGGLSWTPLIGLTLLIAAGAVADIKGEPSMWRRPVLVKLGEWSFAFYMVHLLVMHSLRLWVGDKPKFDTLPAFGLAGLAFVISLALAALLYTYVEEPGRRLVLGKTRLSLRRRR